MDNDYRNDNIYEGEPVYGSGGPSPQRDGNRKKSVFIAVGLVLAMLMGFLGSVIGNAVTGNGHTTMLEGNRPSSVIDLATVDTSKLMTASEVYAANVNSTVGITTSVTTNFWGFQTTSAASGSGFILTADGYILTNFHVIESSSSISVTLYDGTSYDAVLVGYDESNDIAVLKIDASDLSPVVLGDSDNLNVGDDVIAIGNPLGELTFSLTAGAVSALDREITLSSGVMMNLIQTDCAINSGNSGGALFNLYGEVIGITNAKYSSSGTEASIDNIGFAIPINHIRSIVDSIIEKGYISKPYIGVSVGDVSEETMGYGLPAGAAVKSVVEDSPAEKAGIKVNDIITAVNGNEITGRSELSETISSCAVGDKLTLTVYRQGETLSIDVTVGEQTKSALESDNSGSQSNQQQGGSISDFFGFMR
ncbi:MAG: trypsin-like peptidase domain-containing protein [Oscillospiraceae bacterium]|nr:trypsin-like peptidase domain-containing protein [Oscillospiraceae bacterium]